MIVALSEMRLVLAALEMANARIAELEARLNTHKNVIAAADIRIAERTARAERAEARVAEFADKGTLQALRDANDRAERAEAERDAMREALQAIDDGYTKGSAPRLDGGYSLACIARRALAPSPAGPDGRDLAVLYCLERAEADVKLLREALEGMIAVAEGRFDGNPHADIDALAKARATLAPSPAGREG